MFQFILAPVAVPVKLDHLDAPDVTNLVVMLINIYIQNMRIIIYLILTV